MSKSSKLCLQVLSTTRFHSKGICLLAKISTCFFLIYFLIGKHDLSREEILVKERYFNLKQMFCLLHFFSKHLFVKRLRPFRCHRQWILRTFIFRPVLVSLCWSTWLLSLLVCFFAHKTHSKMSSLNVSTAFFFVHYLIFLFYCAY